MLLSKMSACFFPPLTCLPYAVGFFSFELRFPLTIPCLPKNVSFPPFCRDLGSWALVKNIGHGLVSPFLDHCNLLD